jgi:transglutaminase-like putative cysteine protease
MRIDIHHVTTYRYEKPVQHLLQELRMTPRNHAGQFVESWRIETEPAAHLHACEDAFGNTVYRLAIDEPFETMTITAIGTVETEDTAGIVHGAVEPFPPALFLRETALTAPTADMRRWARYIAAAPDVRDDRLALLHAMTREVRETVRFMTGATDAQTSAAQAFAARAGVCQDISQIFIALARTLDIPARYVGGYLASVDDAQSQQEAGHAWAEAYVEGLGWVGFDPANGICVTERHVRTSVGLDYRDAAPVRGALTGGGAESLAVSLRAVHAQQQ